MTLNTYNLITVRNGQIAVIEPLVAHTPEKAIAYAAAMLNDRVKGHEALFTSQSVRWEVDCGDRDILDVAAPVGETLGAFDLVIGQDQPHVLWSPAARA